MGSDNPSGADNQQETAEPRLQLDPNWIVGFVDGEGCFSVSLHRNKSAVTCGGWQLLPVFHVYQHERYRIVLEALQSHFACGSVRAKGPKSSVLTYAVSGLRSLEDRVIPFFEAHPLVVKRADFGRFVSIVRMLRTKEHLTPGGFERAVRLAYSMNEQGKQRARSLEFVLAGSSETARQAPLIEQHERLKIQSELHGDMQSQAEMTWPISSK